MTKIQYWDAESLTMKDSWGDYETAYLVELDFSDPYGEQSQTTKTVYLHEESGIMVHDVAAFETWLRQLRTP